MTTGLTNYATGADPAVSGHLCATDADEPARRAAVIETASSEPEVCANTDLGADSWRVEVAARLERYRTRRKPRAPRYPSLLLPFDAPESWSRPALPSGSAAVATASARAEHDFTLRAYKEERTAVEAPSRAEPRPTSQQAPEQATEPSAKVIEFPRSAAIPVFHPSELADPVEPDRPRIVEAPEILPPPPALGGMLMEPALQEPADSRAGADFPLPSAASPSSIARRALAALVDGVVLAAALAAFAAIFLRLNPLPEPLRPLPMLVGAFAVIAVLLWAAYEFLLVVYTGSTPGLRAARLRLAGFDGSPLNRRSRRWRVLASFLSALSGGLGYLWCVLDQGGLCWHDRITRTQVQSLAKAE